MPGAGHDAESPQTARRQGARRHSRWVGSATVALLLLGGGAAVAAGLLHQNPDPPRPTAEAAGSLSDSTAEPGPAISAGSAPGLRPKQIRIPAIGVRSPLTTIGLAPNGTLEVPQPGPNYDKAAWFGGSPAPGQAGPAVIEGHVDGKVHGPSVFYRLGALKPGNAVLVTRTDGTVVRFTVYAVRLYPKNSFPRLTVYGNTSTHDLRLITCGGSFDSHRKAGGYKSNVVVFARQA